jgi:hypothetical protein
MSLLPNEGTGVKHIPSLFGRPARGRSGSSPSVWTDDDTGDWASPSPSARIERASSTLGRMQRRTFLLGVSA